MISYHIYVIDISSDLDSPPAHNLLLLQLPHVPRELFLLDAHGAQLPRHLLHISKCQYVNVICICCICVYNSNI